MTLILCVSLICNQAAARGITQHPDGFTISLTGQAQEAIENGITLTFNCEFAIINRFLFFTRAQQPRKHQFVVTRHALSNRYIVRHDNQQEPHSFRSLRASMNFIAAEATLLYTFYQNSNKHYQMRLALSKYELPGPIRLSAFLAKDWDLDTGWIKWELER